MKTIKFQLTKTKKSKTIKSFFTKVFSNSANKQEGKIVGNLSLKLAKIIDEENVIGIEGIINNKIVAYIFLTKLIYQENCSVYLLAPVAVDSNYQKKGIGKKIIKYAIKFLKKKNVDLLMTYGDPKYYSKTGFKKTKVSLIQAPYRLSQPIGWLVNNISKIKIKLKSKPQCVKPFRYKKLW